MARMKPSPLSRFELLLRRLVEEPFAWFAGDSPDAAGLAAYLWRLWHEAPAAERPELLTVYLSPEQYANLAYRSEEIAGQVREHLVFLAESNGESRLGLPEVALAADESLSGRRVRVAGTRADAPDSPATQVFSPDAAGNLLDDIRAVDAFLIVEGTHHVPLDRPVTRIGRRVDNDLVLDSAAVSRQHAQIRWRQPYFMLYDVSGHGRTLVNGEPIQERVLRPGDVIALSDVLLVYGEGRDMPAPVNPGDGDVADTLLKPVE
jgi:hypothetical protein